MRGESFGVGGQAGESPLPALGGAGLPRPGFLQLSSSLPALHPRRGHALGVAASGPRGAERAVLQRRRRVRGGAHAPPALEAPPPRGSRSPAPAQCPLLPPGPPQALARPGWRGLGARLPGAGGSHLLRARRGAGDPTRTASAATAAAGLPSPAASLLLRDAGAHSRLMRST